MKTLFVAMTAATLIGGATSVFGQEVASHDPASVKAGSYKVDAYHTQAVFSVSHFGFTEFYGTFSNAAGTLKLDPAHVGAAKLEITLPVDSVLTTSTKLNDELKGAQWFDAAKFPNATFASTKVTETGKGGATVEGKLTLHGVTKPVKLDVTFVGAGTNPLSKAYTVGFSATATIKRSEFGVATYVPLVGDDVKLTLTGAFEKQD